MKEEKRFLKVLAIIIIFSLNLLSGIGYAQNYAEYYQLINKAEEKFVLQRDSACYVEYDNAFKNFQPFLKDTYIASQIALFLGDTLKYFDYLKLCFENGMPISALNASLLVKRANTDALYSQISDLYSKSYKPVKVDKEILNEICLRCYQSDSIKTFMGSNDSLINLYYESENQAREYLLVNFLNQGVFPNQRMIGITTDKMLNDFFSEFNRPDVFMMLTGKPGHQQEEFSLRTKCPYNIILHSKCFFRQHIELFRTVMLNGYLHPMDFGILEETSILWHHSNKNATEDCGPPEVKTCYNIFGNSPLNSSFNIFTNTEEGLKQVEINRELIYMQKYSVDLQKKELEEGYGFKFFFDFKNR